MLRKVSVAALSAALIFATTPSFGCTGISLNAKDGTMVRGRTMEFGFPLSSNVIVIPAGTALAGTLPDGKQGLAFTTNYSMVGANAVGRTVIMDGLNDRGLSFGLFYFPGFAEYPVVTSENAEKAMAPFEFGAWVLGNFASVDELKQALAQGDAITIDSPLLSRTKYHAEGLRCATWCYDQRAVLRLAHHQFAQLHQSHRDECAAARS